MDRDSAKELLKEIFPIGSRKEFVVEAPSEKRKRGGGGKLSIGRFPLGAPPFAEDYDKEWKLEKYDGDPETGEPGGWMLEDNPGSKTHKGTPSSSEDVQNVFVLRFTDSATLEAQRVSDAFNFRPTIRHKVYTVEEAEMLMSVKRKPRLASSLKAQLDAADAQKTTGEADDPNATGNNEGPVSKSLSESDSDTEGRKVKDERKKRKVVVEREVRAARALREVVATDALIAEIKPKNVEDWEYDEGEADDDVSMGSDFEDQEKDKLEAEYRMYIGSDSSEDEETSKLDKKAKELKKLIKNGASEFVPQPASSEGQSAKPSTVPDSTKPNDQANHRSENNNQAPSEQSTNPGPQPVTEVPSFRDVVPQEVKQEQSDRVRPHELSEAEVLRFLRTVGSVPLKSLIKPFKQFIDGKEEHRQFKNIVKKIAIMDGTKSAHTVTLKEEYR